MGLSLLPLFPLPLVLFPGTPLPLHIFEPRYRTMLADCLRGDRRFGIRTVEALLASAVGSIETHAHVHRRARSNGHGPHPVA